MLFEYRGTIYIKFGLYTSVGTTTCRGDPGSYGHFTQDAQTFASWEVDYVKIDWCGSNCKAEGHQEMSDALNKTGRPIVLELCRGAYQNQTEWGYAPKVAQLWRATGDHHDDWKSTEDQVNSVVGKTSWSKPYGWAYLDMLMTGGQGCKGQSNDEALHCPGQTDAEYRTEFGLYAISSSPLLIGTDIRNMTTIMKDIILNTEVLAVNQDYMSTPGDVVSVCSGKHKVWVRKLSNGKIAVAASNMNGTPAAISICFSDIGGGDSMAVRDLWMQSDLGVHQTMYTKTVGVHDTLFVILTKN